MPGWWKLAAVAVLAVWLFAGGYWLNGLVAEAGQADVLREQIKVNRAEQERVNGVAQAAEAKLATERQKSANINRKWSKIREAENRAVCTIDDDTLGMLRDATLPAGVPAR